MSFKKMLNTVRRGSYFMDHPLMSPTRTKQQIDHIHFYHSTIIHLTSSISKLNESASIDFSRVAMVNCASFFIGLDSFNIYFFVFPSSSPEKLSSPIFLHSNNNMNIHPFSPTIAGPADHLLSHDSMDQTMESAYVYVRKMSGKYGT